ncbi:MAG TPA: hypothetical protein VK901_07120 [Nitrospiraceae bacterium]|nr:hypothetical protein [Nitrospiraceae bacterium]
MRAVIFVTDDEQATRSAITERLTRQGHHVVGYESGKALLEGLQHNLPDSYVAQCEDASPHYS